MCLGMWHPTPTPYPFSMVQWRSHLGDFEWFPSDWYMPDGSRREGTLAEFKDRWMMSFRGEIWTLLDTEDLVRAKPDFRVCVRTGICMASPD